MKLCLNVLHQYWRLAEKLSVYLMSTLGMGERTEFIPLTLKKYACGTVMENWKI